MRDEFVIGWNLPRNRSELNNCRWACEPNIIRPIIKLVELLHFDDKPRLVIGPLLESAKTNSCPHYFDDLAVARAQPLNWKMLS